VFYREYTDSIKLEIIVQCSAYPTTLDEVFKYVILNVIICFLYVICGIFVECITRFYSKMRGQQTIVKLLKRVKVLRSVKVYLALVMVVTSIAATTALTLLTTTTIATEVYGQTAGMALQNIKATYAVEIVPGAAQKTNLLHYYPPAIAVPVGTTVGWFNNDREQPHTVTSGLSGASDSGALFNSGFNGI
jgi:plastocyanin